jgi:hypothetical protein
MDDLDYKLYVLAELSYKKEHPEIPEEDLFPIGWYSTENYKLKNEIIAEALREKILVENTKKYMFLQEGVRKSH